MTKEEEKAIERLTNGKKIDFDTLIRKFKKEGIENFVITKKEYIETVLNMLKEKDKLYHKALGDLVKADRENIQLKKQIDLMATTLSAICTGLSTVREHFEKEYCEFINSDKDCCWKTDTSCKDCIKQYFERKVRDERN